MTTTSSQHHSRFISLLFILAYSAIASASAWADYPSAPDFKILTDDESHIHLSDLKGKLIYVDFWASWCRPCKKSFPWMIALQQKYKHQNFQIIAINLDKDKQKAHEFINSQAINFPIVFDPQANIAKQFNVQGMPSSYLIGPDGKVRIRYTGFWNKSKSDKEQTIQNMLNNL